MNQTCKVCGEPAAGFHFGAFTCEGCKSFFGRSYNNVSSISECKNNGKCIIDKKNRTTCKACRLRKCYNVGMSKGGSRYGRRSNWFKIHCLLQEQQQQALEAAGKASSSSMSGAMLPANGFGDMAAVAAAAAAKHHMQQLNPHIGGLLGYPSYHLQEMMQVPSPFLSAAARHPTEATAAATLPFFNMINTLPSIGSASSAFQMAPNLLFSAGYLPNDAYHSEMYKHRQSVDSEASAESQRCSPAARRSYTSADEEQATLPANENEEERQSPELFVSGDDDEEQHPSIQQTTNYSGSYSHSHSPAVSVAKYTHIQSPVTPSMHPSNSTLPITPPLSFGSDQHHSSPRTTPKPAAVAPATAAEMPTPATSAADESTTLSFASKAQALSPLSVCSIGGETTLTAKHEIATNVNDQDCPIDLSMKSTSSRNFVQSFNATADECDVRSETSIEETQVEREIRRKYFQIVSEPESDASSDASSALGALKRQKVSQEGYNSRAFAHGSAPTSLRGIFVCV